MSSAALDNMRAVVVVIVVAFHAAVAYVAFLPAVPYGFDDQPYLWHLSPIIDQARFAGFDLFCAWQDVSLISLFYLLSGVFVWPSLKRKGSARFVAGRLLRLGLPFAVVVGFLTPLADYASYRVTAVDPSFVAFWRHWLALPFWPSGPPWFLWILLVLDCAAALLHMLAPRAGDVLGRLFAPSLRADDRPLVYFACVVAASALAYVPLALAFTPWAWSEHGPFGFQICRPLHYAVYFFAGVGAGACGLERGLLAVDGKLARGWTAWLAAAVALFVLWMGATALTLNDPATVPLALRVVAALSFVLACAAGCFCFLALFLRFAARPLPGLARLKDNAYGIFLVHYVFVLWLQYALLDVALPALAKFAVVFGAALLLSLVAAATLRRVPAAARVLGAERRVVAKAS
jgi:peptidoglycan/LPS O-acetylase OafA/YrhL